MTEEQQIKRAPAKDILRERGGIPADVVAVRGEQGVVDLHTPVAVDAKLELVRATEPDGLRVIRHSTAHVMADAVQRLFPGTQVTIGPAIEDGFYYDFDRKSGPFTEDDLRTIEAEMARIVKANSPFRRDVVGRAEALDRFAKMGETYKLEIIKSVPEGEELSFYVHGKPGEEWIDFCEGPHVPSTGMLKAVKLTSVAGAYWRGDERNPMLQRIYGTAFASQKELDEHLRLIEEAKKRDHRKLGKELDLFMFHEYAPAMPFLLPRGTRLMNRLVEFVRSIYDEQGYDEVSTPQIFDRKLFETSGHMANYRENMYLPMTSDRLDQVNELIDRPLAGSEEGERLKLVKARLHEIEHLAQKPMNCPSHCLIFANKRRSYRELPMRLADFGRLHRYERGGVVHGLARVRSFSQDDAHIFCTPATLEAEMSTFLKTFYKLYEVFAFTKVDVKLATRPEKRLGSDAMWDEAEGALARSLQQAGLAFEYLPGEGAFYGPKLEFHVHDALKRSWQLGTLQLDYALPERFELSYIGEDGGQHRPIMLHRAWYGSLERFLAVLIEHVGGAFPTWLAPDQVVVVTVSEKQEAYANEVVGILRAQGVRVQADLSADKLGAKIRNGRLMRYPYLVVVGNKEAEQRTVSPRSQEKGELGSMSLEAFVDLVVKEAALPRLGISLLP
jgi:threonyl-tRNA synthetase